MIYVQVVCEIIIWSRVNLIWFGWRFTLLSILTTKQSLYLVLWFNSCRSRRLTLYIQLYCYRLQRDRDTGQPTTWHCVLFEIITCFHSIIISGQYSGTFWSLEPASSQSIRPICNGPAQLLSSLISLCGIWWQYNMSQNKLKLTWSHWMTVSGSGKAFRRVGTTSSCTDKCKAQDLYRTVNMRWGLIFGSVKILAQVEWHLISFTRNFKYQVNLER